MSTKTNFLKSSFLKKEPSALTTNDSFLSIIFAICTFYFLIVTLTAEEYVPYTFFPLTLLYALTL